VETYILDFEGELLGQKLTIDLVEKLRGEERFDNVEQLKAQMIKDVEQARQILNERMKRARV
jgi:riboflavin kinase/FMN adenylyltransferase